jgi:hypothetical protein
MGGDRNLVQPRQTLAFCRSGHCSTCACVLAASRIRGDGGKRNWGGCKVAACTERLPSAFLLEACRRCRSGLQPPEARSSCECALFRCQGAALLLIATAQELINFLFVKPIRSLRSGTHGISANIYWDSWDRDVPHPSCTPRMCTAAELDAE